MRPASPILRWSIASVVAGCLAAGASRGASAQDQSSTASPPRTAGEVALLGNKMDAAAVKGVFEAISAADPLVRTVAARVAGVSGHPAFAVPIASALEREQHATAAGEQVRALLLIRGAAALEAIEMRTPNLDPGAVEVFALWIANNQPQRLADLLTKLTSRVSADRGELSGSIAAALKRFETRPVRLALHAVLRGRQARSSPDDNYGEFRTPVIV